MAQWSRADAGKRDTALVARAALPFGSSLTDCSATISVGELLLEMSLQLAVRWRS